MRLPLADITIRAVTRQPALTRTAVMLFILLMLQPAVLFRKIVRTRAIACACVSSAAAGCAVPAPSSKGDGDRANNFQKKVIVESVHNRSPVCFFEETINYLSSKSKTRARHKSVRHGP